MDKTTLKDIRQRIARWQKEEKTNGRESDRTWIFAVNIDDVNLLLSMIEHLEKENADLRLQLLQAKEQPNLSKLDAIHNSVRTGFQDYINQHPPVKMDSAALEPDDQPDGQMKHWFNTATGPYQALDTFSERAFTWSRGPFTSWHEANLAWKEYIKRQRENG